jgi:hypothetical protein
MYEAVAAKQQVSLWKDVFTKIEGAKLPRRTAVADSRMLDQSRNDVAPDVVSYRKLYLGHPMQVATRQIKEGVDSKLTDKHRKGFS